MIRRVPFPFVARTLQAPAVALGGAQAEVRPRLTPLMPLGLAVASVDHGKELTTQ